MFHFKLLFSFDYSFVQEHYNIFNGKFEKIILKRLLKIYEIKIKTLIYKVKVIHFAFLSLSYQK